MSEKLTGADHTKLDDKFTHMEKVTDVFLEVEVRRRNILYSSTAVINHFPGRHNHIDNNNISDRDVRENQRYSVPEPSS